MMGWFYGFKLHLIINNQSGIISVKMTTVNVNDKKPVS
ncbi:Mobile element protein [Candidatus Enterovibrio escicola]|uniref:Mobile element protein n=1 Tax=Candidatus Enterovibrio escicola TaxID=1927127 RepID=A0A2A5T0H4_9GAMM|nr:Mobile element protein [Candidatus Enterovibrio escacola]